MFRLYICSRRQTGYRTLNKKTIKYNTILQLYNFVARFCYWRMYARLVFISFRQDIPVLFKCTYVKKISNLLMHGLISSLTTATYVQPKHVAVFTCTVKVVYRLNTTSFLYISLNAAGMSCLKKKERGLPSPDNWT